MTKKKQARKAPTALALNPSKQAPLPHESYYTEEWLEWTKAIRALNDAFRLSFTSTELYCSPELMKLPVEAQETILEQVRHYRRFNEVNDPLMMHNQGFFLFEGHRIVWTVYCYEEEQSLTQTKPVNLDLTKRHMMIMMADEWWENLPENIF